MIKNYLVHEEKVEFYENYLNQSKEWQYFIELIEDRFEINEIDSFKDFLNQVSTIETIINYWISIIKCAPTRIDFKNRIFEEIYFIAEFYIGKKSKSEVEKVMFHNISKVLFLVIWITKLENVDNKTNYTIDLRLFTQKNISSLLILDSLAFNEDEIFSFMDSLALSDLDIFRKELKDNIDGIVYPADTDFLENYRNRIIQVDSFNFTSIKVQGNITWEMSYLLDMLNIGIKDHKIIPQFSFGESITPDYKLWTRERLDELQNYFNHDVSDYIIESIKYVLYEVKPSNKTISSYINLFSENCKTAKTSQEKYNNSTFRILSYLSKDKSIDRNDLRLFYIEISKVEDIKELKILNTNNISLNKKQKKLLANYYKTSFTRLDNVENLLQYTQYLENEDNAKLIDNIYFNKNKKLFDQYIIKDNSVRCATLFIKYMIFLMRLKENINLSKEDIENEMIRIQKLWENEYYDICCSNLDSVVHKFEIEKKHIEEFNEIILQNIFDIATLCVITKIEKYIEEMERISNNALLTMISSVNLNRVFPVDDNFSFDIERHDVDKLTVKIVDDIKSKYGYRFLNDINSKVYVKNLHKSMREKAIFYFGFFNKTKELYDIVQIKLNDYNLIDYDGENTTLAHITQLFPIIEIMVKKVGVLYHIFPFKEEEKSFMQSKDPSSILRIILEKAYDETNSFENVPDLLFIYHFLYNSNSLNIRNECMHGRDYLSGNSLQFALKVTLSALYMLIMRIEIITSNKK